MRKVWLVGVALLGVPVAAVAESITVPGTNVEFPTQIEASVGGKDVKMGLTGTALRRRFGFNIYAMASYLQDGVKVQKPEDLVSSNAPKRLELVMQRNVSGKDMAERFVYGVRLNHPAPAFDDQIKKLQEVIAKQALSRGDKVLLTNIPNVGLNCTVPGKIDMTIKGVKFSESIWEIYFGKTNISETIRKDLLSRN